MSAAAADRSSVGDGLFCIVRPFAYGAEASPRTGTSTRPGGPRCGWYRLAVPWAHDTWRRWPAVALVSALATVFTWRAAAWRGVSAGISSWQVGLALASEQHLQWGPQVLFTFGPYGFVEDILPLYRVQAAIAFIYALVVTWALVALVIAALRPAWGLLPAAVVAWLSIVIAANLLEAPELALGTALGLALASVWDQQERARSRLPVALGALAGFQLLVELNVGLVTTSLALLAVLGGERRGRRALATILPWFVVPAVAAVAAGQSIANVVSYLGGSLQVTLGYNSAMSSSGGRGTEDVFAVVLVAVVGALYWLASRGQPRAVKAAMALMLAGWGWEALKEGFVRHDLHDLTFFSLMLIAICLARLPRPLVPLQAAAATTAAIIALVANGGVPPSMRSPLEDASAIGHDIADLVVSSRFTPLSTAARHELLTTGDALANPLVSSLRGFTVAAQPWEDGLSYVYPQLRWRPIPVLQSYSAYTTYLDDRDASFLSSARAPQRILYQAETIDGRDPFWDSPSAQVALYCHYVQVGTSGPWQVLARVPDRCGQPRYLSQAEGRFGQRIRVPDPKGDLVVASFSLSTPLTATLEAIALKPPQTQVIAWAQGKSTTYRFLPGTAPSLHIIGTRGAIGYSSPFTPPTISAVAFSGGGWAPRQGTVRVTFFAIALP